MQLRPVIISWHMALLFVLSATSFIFGNGASAAMVPLAKIGKNVVKLEVAQSRAQIEKGLMFRTSLPEDAGMVFLFHPQRPVRFWMHNCFISLDMLFIKDGKIIQICHDVPPCKAAKSSDCPLYPESGEIEVTEVLEVNAGYAAKHGIKEGDEVKFEVTPPVSDGKQ